MGAAKHLRSGGRVAQSGRGSGGCRCRRSLPLCSCSTDAASHPAGGISQPAYNSASSVAKALHLEASRQSSISSWPNPSYDPASSLAYMLHPMHRPRTAECASEQAAQCRALTPRQQPGSQSPIQSERMKPREPRLLPDWAASVRALCVTGCKTAHVEGSSDTREVEQRV